MRRFFCERCDERVGFDSLRCDSCLAELGYVPEVGDVKVLTAGPPTVYSVAGPGPERRRCLNAAWGCSWTLAIDDLGDWCRSCRLTHGRPDGSDTAAVAAWISAEAAKRRLVH